MVSQHTGVGGGGEVTCALEVTELLPKQGENQNGKNILGLNWTLTHQKWAKVFNFVY